MHNINRYDFFYQMSTNAQMLYVEMVARAITGKNHSGVNVRSDLLERFAKKVWE